MSSDSSQKEEAILPPLRPVTHLLKEAGVEDWDPHVLYQLLEFQYTATKSILDGAFQFAQHRKATSLVEKDVKIMLALQGEKKKMKGNAIITEMRCNVQELPTVKRKADPKLPPRPNTRDKSFSFLPEESMQVDEGEQHTDSNQLELEAEERKKNAAGKYNVKAKPSSVQINTPGSIAGVELKPPVPQRQVMQVETSSASKSDNSTQSATMSD